MKNKKIIISIILICMIVVTIVIVTVLNQNVSKSETENNEESTGTKWGDTYYLYLLNNYGKGKNYESNSEKIEELNAKFVEVDSSENPVLLLSGESEDGETKVTILGYINDDGFITTINESNTEFKYLYDIESGEYNWYIKLTTDVVENYVKVDSQIESLKMSSKAYSEVANEKGVDKNDLTFDDVKDSETYKNSQNIILENETSFKKSANEEVSEKTNGDLVLTEFEQKFIEIDKESLDIPEYTFKVGSDIDIKSVTELVSNYKTADKLITDSVKKKVEDKIQIVESNQEENAGFKLSNDAYTYKYGTYLHREKGKYTGIKITINADGNYIYQNASESRSGTYTIVEEYDGKAIKFDGLEETRIQYFYYAGNQDVLTEEQSNSQLIFEQ